MIFSPVVIATGFYTINPVRKPLQQVLFVEKDNPQSYAEIYCDGASSGNPGNSGIGVIIRYKPSYHELSSEPQITVRRISNYIGVATNNIAEYLALIRGLKEAKALGLKKIRIFLDSALLVKQINGLYRVKNANLKQLWSQAQSLLKGFDSYVITHVERELNKEVDLLAKMAIRNHKKE